MLKLFEACNNEDTTSDELSKIISLDPSLCAKTMQMANSPYMGGVHQTISSLAEAVSYLGEDTIKNLAVLP